MLKSFYENERLAVIYYAYHSLHRYLEEPFTSLLPEALFNIARFLMAETSQNKPSGISLLYPSLFNLNFTFNVVYPHDLILQ